MKMFNVTFVWMIFMILCKGFTGLDVAMNSMLIVSVLTCILRVGWIIYKFLISLFFKANAVRCEAK